MPGTETRGGYMVTTCQEGREQKDESSQPPKLKSTVVVPRHSALYTQVKPRMDLEVLENHKEDYINIVMIGHRYVSRLRWAQIEYMRAADESMAEAVNLNNTGINPFFYGRGGVMLCDIPTFVRNVRRHFPSAILLEIGQNDLCWNECNPEQLADSLYLEIQLMFESLEFLKLVSVCKVLRKWDNEKMKGDKKIDQLNVDINIFNHEFLQISRKDTRIIRWGHAGLTQLTKITSTDGTHPNTIGGYWRYLKSVSAACKYTRKEMFLREGKSIWSIIKRKKAIRKIKSSKRQQNKLHKLALAGEK